VDPPLLSVKEAEELSETDMNSVRMWWDI
jgi:hypothetical protein